jgi:lysine 2-monooxygenase
MSDDSGVISCAIVGGGMGGVYSAWRLATAPDRKIPARGIHLYEMSDRIGGRLYTVTLPGMPHVRLELGGMRIMKSQPIIWSLIHRLGFAPEPFPMGDSRNLVYLRGKRFAQAGFADPATVPYDLAPWERGLSPSGLVVHAISKIIPGATDMTNAQLRAACQVAELNGFPLRQHGFWQILLNTLSIEGYNLALAGGGFNTVPTNWNAAEAIPWFMEDWSNNPDETQYYSLPEGYEALPWRLRDRFEAAGGAVHTGQELIAFTRNRDGLIELTFRDHGTGMDRRVVARRLVLAMPQRSLELLAGHAPDRPSASPFFDQEGVMDLIGTVTGRTLYKFALAYPQPWWHPLGLRSGESISDLPLRQVYYFGTEGEQPGGDPLNRNSLIVASYTDGISVNYWEGVRRSGPDFTGAPNPFVKRDESAGPPTVSTLMVNEGHRQLCELHDLPDAPPPYAAAFHDWGDDPYGGGWHSWNIGIDTRAAMARIVKPAADYEVYICGESYSTYQGWVEGALQTAEMMLTGHFGLAAPSPAS